MDTPIVKGFLLCQGIIVLAIWLINANKASNQQIFVDSTAESPLNNSAKNFDAGPVLQV